MTIDNQTNYVLSINNVRIIPDVRRKILSHALDTMIVYSDIGSVLIHCSYSDKMIRCYGNLDIKESDELDADGSKILVATEKGAA